MPKQIFDFADYFGAVAVWIVFFSILFLLSVTVINFCCIGKNDDITVIEEWGYRHRLGRRLGVHRPSFVASRVNDGGFKHDDAEPDLRSTTVGHRNQGNQAIHLDSEGRLVLPDQINLRLIPAEPEGELVFDSRFPSRFGNISHVRTGSSGQPEIIPIRMEQRETLTITSTQGGKTTTTTVTKVTKSGKK